eukprot:2350957-Heterocapsa_arctica.AAC.1
MIYVDAGNFIKGLPKETAETITEETIIKLSGNIFRKSALMHVMQADGTNTLKATIFGTQHSLFEPDCPTPLSPQVIRQNAFPELLHAISLGLMPWLTSAGN